MPRRDGTGPTGAGAMTGRGLGACTDARATNAGSDPIMGFGRGRACGRGLGLGLGRGFGRGFGRGIGGGFGRGLGLNRTSPEAQKELLNEQKTMLKNRLEWIDKQLEDL